METIGILTIFMKDGSKQTLALSSAVARDSQGQRVGNKRIEQNLVDTARTIGGKNYDSHSVYLEN